LEGFYGFFKDAEITTYDRIPILCEISDGTREISPPQGKTGEKPVMYSWRDFFLFCFPTTYQEAKSLKSPQVISGGTFSEP
jgi:hypothetical protein